MKHSEDMVDVVTPVFRTVLYDLDGTLINSSHDIATAFQWALQQVTGDEPPPVEAITAHIGKPLATMARAIGYTFAPQRLETFLATYRRYYATHCAEHTQPYPGVTTTLEALAHLTFGVVTTKAQDQAEVVLQRLKMTQYFRHIQGWQPGLQLKPAPDMVAMTLAALHGEPESALMVGDTPADIQAGKAASVQTCAVTYGFGNPDELLACAPDYCISSFDALLVIVQG